MPSALSLLTTFSKPEERGKAFGVFGAIAVAGGAIGPRPRRRLRGDVRRRRRPAPQDAGVASATVNVGQQLGASIGTSPLNTLFTAAVASCLAANLASARPIGRQAVAGLALAHGYDTAFWWIAGIFGGGAVICGVLLRNGPLTADRTPSPAAGNPGQGEIAGIR